jgi:hypothetical protein
MTMRNSPKLERLVSGIEQELIKQGKIIAGGFAGYRMMVMASDAPDVQVLECKMAFFAGAQHLYTTMMRVMDEGEEPTDADLSRMELIHEELQQFVDQILEPLHANSVKAKGSA